MPEDLTAPITGFADTWKYLSSEHGAKRLTLANLLSRFDLAYGQAARWWDPAEGGAADTELCLVHGCEFSRGMSSMFLQEFTISCWQLAKYCLLNSVSESSAA
jgi:hypothetical protein